MQGSSHLRVYVDLLSPDFEIRPLPLQIECATLLPYCRHLLTLKNFVTEKRQSLVGCVMKGRSTEKCSLPKGEGTTSTLEVAEITPLNTSPCMQESNPLNV